MRDDVRKLMKKAGLPENGYREIAAEERQQAAEDDWPLLGAVNRRLALRAAQIDAGAGAGGPGTEGV